MITGVDSVALAGATVGRCIHVCAFFDSPEEEYRMMLPFVQDGIARGERAFHIVNADRRKDHLARLRQGGIDVSRTQATRQLEIREPSETYLRGTQFNPNAMLALIQLLLRTGPSLGYRGMRLVAQADSVPEDPERQCDWVEYEARLNLILPEFNDPLICVYNSHRLAPGTAIDILRTHPIAIVGGELQHNPYFSPPIDILRELRARKGATAGKGPVTHADY